MGETHCVMLLVDTSLIVMGSNEYGQLGMQPSVDNYFVDSLTKVELEGLSPSEDVIERVVCGKNHTVILVRNVEGEKRIMAFGFENGMGVNGMTSTHVPQQINIPKMKNMSTDLEILYSRHNSNIVVDKRNRVFVWGEDTTNLRLRKPKLLYIFPKKVKQVCLGKRHGIVLTDDFGLYGWGDGTYGELGITEGLPIESPTIIPYFQNMKLVSVATGARHTLALDKEGNIYAMGDNSEDQCAISGRRANVPEKLLKDFNAKEIYAGDSHNVAISDSGQAYHWGGTLINTAWVRQDGTESKLKPMEDLKRRKVNFVDLSYSNTMIITGQ